MDEVGLGQVEVKATRMVGEEGCGQLSRSHLDQGRCFSRLLAPVLPLCSPYTQNSPAATPLQCHSLGLGSHFVGTDSPCAWRSTRAPLPSFSGIPNPSPRDPPPTFPDLIFQPSWHLLHTFWLGCSPSCPPLTPTYPFLSLHYLVCPGPSPGCLDTFSRPPSPPHPPQSSSCFCTTPTMQTEEAGNIPGV